MSARVMFTAYYEGPRTHAGCCFIPKPQADPCYLPLIDVNSHATIFNVAYTTRLKQVFRNPLARPLEEVSYAFPLRDGVSVAHFKCTIAGETLFGVVMQKQQAKKTFDTAVERGESAGLLTQSVSAGDVMTTHLGNVPANENVTVEITYIGELNSDAQIGGVRYMLPSVIVPRYGTEVLETPGVTFTRPEQPPHITVDILLPDTMKVKRVVSPSHLIDVSIGVVSTDSSAESALNKASAVLALKEPALDKDFVLQFSADDLDKPTALLETHPTLKDHRAVMITGVPNWKLPETNPEIIFVCDRSGSMSGTIDILRASIGVFLKSLPIGVKFNICSFGSHHELLWPKSQDYTEASLLQAERYVASFAADFGGTEMVGAVEAILKSRLDMPTEVILLTDGEIWDQQGLFDVINRERKDAPVRFFGIGLGDSVSTSLVEGIARAGGGFAEFAATNEAVDAKLVRLLKGALSPHITAPSLHIMYDDEEYDIVHSDLQSQSFEPTVQASESEPPKADSFLPKFTPPAPLMTPAGLPALFPFNRFTAYLLLSPAAKDKEPSRVKLRVTTAQGRAELDIDIKPASSGDTIHKLAARKAMQDLEEGHGWLQNTKDSEGKTAGERFSTLLSSLVEKECVRIGVTYQVINRHCSFVAVQSQEETMQEKVEQLIRKLEEHNIDQTTGEDDTLKNAGTNQIPALSISKSMQQSGGARPSVQKRKARSSARVFGTDPPLRPATGGHFGVTATYSRNSAPGQASSSPLKVPKTPNPAVGYAMTAMPTPAPTYASRSGAISALRRSPSDSEGRFSPACGSPYRSDEELSMDIYDDSGTVSVQDAQAPNHVHVSLTQKMDMTTGGEAKENYQENEDGDQEAAHKEALFYALVQAQLFKGNWSATNVPFEQMRISKDDFDKAVKKIEEKSKLELASDALATACVLRVLELQLAGLRDRWELISTKGHSWLHASVGPEARSMLDEEAIKLVQD